MSFILYSGTPRSRAYIVSISRPVKRSSRASNYKEKMNYWTLARRVGPPHYYCRHEHSYQINQFYDYTAGRGSIHKLSPRFITLSQQRYKIYSRQKLRNNCLKGGWKKKHVYKVKKYRNLNVLIDKTVETRLKIVSHHVSKCKKKMDVYSPTNLPSIKRRNTCTYK